MLDPKSDIVRTELVRAFRDRYLTATRKAKRIILNELIALTGYHPKAAIRALNAAPQPSTKERRRRPKLYDEAAKQALIVLWEASDRLCGKRLVAMLPRLLASLERHGHLSLDGAIREQILKMRSATIDRLLRAPKRANKNSRLRRVEPAVRRRIKVRTFADWNEPPPGSMEMDLVAHCGDVNRGSYVNSLVLTDIASGWTECAPLVVRESGLLTETVDRIRTSLPFALRALDVDNGSEFVNEAMIQYCLRHGIELTRSRPYRKNDQCYIEQKNGAIVRRHLGYRRFEGITAGEALSRLYGVSRLFVNFFQPSFKLAEKHREGAHVLKRYHAPQTPCERLLQVESIPEATKAKLREVSEGLDPLRLLEEMRAVQLHLVALSKGEKTPVAPPQSPDLAAFLASLASAWRAGEVRPTHGAELNTTYQRLLAPRSEAQKSGSPVIASSAKVIPIKPSFTRPADRPLWAGMDPEIRRKSEFVQRECARKRIRRQHAFTLVWPIVCRRLESRPNLSASELFDELCTLYPGRYHPGQRAAFSPKVTQWKKDAIARGVVIGKRTERSGGVPKGRRCPDPLQAYWPEMLQCLEADPDQTSLELMATIMSRHPGSDLHKSLRTLQRRVKIWRQEAVQRLICQLQEATHDVSAVDASTSLIA